jgi:hypothetical protein
MPTRLSRQPSTLAIEFTQLVEDIAHFLSVLYQPCRLPHPDNFLICNICPSLPFAWENGQFTKRLVKFLGFLGEFTCIPPKISISW